MSTAVVTGASGFIGTHLVATLASRGWRVRVPARDQELNGCAALERLPAELTLTSRADAWARCLDDVDVVFHLAGIAHRQASADALRAVNAQSPAMLASAAAAAGVRRLVWLSSVKVLGDVSAKPLAEDAPYAPTDGYGVSKMHGEQGLLAVPRPGVSIVRPPLVYGPGVKANFLALLSLARRARQGWPLPLGGARAPRSVVGVANLCDFLMLLADSSAEGADGVLHVADAKDLCVVELLEMLNDGQPLRLWRVPGPLAAGGLRVLGQGAAFSRLFEPLQLDCRKTRAQMGWQPPAASAELLRETMAWYLQR